MSAFVVWALAHPFASLSFLGCAAAWGALSDGVRVPEWLIWLATLAAMLALYHSVIGPWLFGH